MGFAHFMVHRQLYAHWQNPKKPAKTPSNITAGLLVSIQRIKLMQLGLQQFLVGELSLIFRDQCWRKRTVQGVLDDFVVFAGTQQDPKRRIFMGLADIAIQSLKVEVQLAEVFSNWRSSSRLDHFS